MPRLIAPYVIPWLLRLGARNHPEMLWSLPDHSKVALTFDDGPGCHTAALLDVLAENKVAATFFVLGSRCRIYPGLVQRIHHEGHLLALHGMGHQSYTSMTSESLTHAWSVQRQQLADLAPGLPALNLCRPPFGHAGRREQLLALDQGLTLVQMTCLPGRHVLWPAGWEEPPDLMAKRVAHEIQPGGIITLHDGENLGLDDGVYTQPHVADTTRRVIKEVRQRGLNFGTIQP